MLEQMAMIQNYIYFYHLEEFCVLPLYPDSVTDSMNSSFSDTNALSRSAPVWSYSNSGPRTVSVKLKLHRDMMNDLNRNVSNIKRNVVDFRQEDYVDILVKYLQTVALPKYSIYKNGSKSVMPPIVALRFGNDIFIKGIVNNGINVTYSKPIMVGNRYAQIDIDFTITEIDPYDADSVKQKGSFRGISSTFKSGIFKDNNASTPNASYQTGNSSTPNNSDNSNTHITIPNTADKGISKIKSNYFINGVSG